MYQQGCTLCNREGHHNELIQAACMKKGCEEPIACCKFCISDAHEKDHQKNDFVQIHDLQRQAESSLEYLTQLASISQQISQTCHSWYKSIVKLIDQLGQHRQLGEIPTVAELFDYARRTREGIAPQKETKLVENFQILLQKIEMSLKKLSHDTNELLEYKEPVLKYIPKKKKKNFQLDRLQFILTQQRRGDDEKISSVVISSDDQYLAAVLKSFNDKNYEKNYDPGPVEYVVLINLKNDKLVKCFDFQNEVINSLKFSKQGGRLGICRGSQFEFCQVNHKDSNYRLSGHTGTVTDIAFTDDSDHLISVSRDKSIRVWNLKDLEEINKQNCEDELLTVTYSHQQQLIACLDVKGKACLFDCTTLSDLKFKIKGQAQSEPYGCIQFIIKSTVLMISSPNQTRFFQVDDLLKGKFYSFRDINVGGSSIKVYPIDKPKAIISCSDCKFIHFWNYDTIEQIQTLEVPDGLVTESFAITSDCRMLITGGLNKKMNVFEQVREKKQN